MASVHGIPPTRGQLRQPLGTRLLSLAKVLSAWWRALPDRVLTRRGLMELSDEDLRDLGFRRKHPTNGLLRRVWRF